MSTKKLVSIVGPTATGKTNLALQLIKVVSQKFPNIDLISADSRQVYQGMEVGTGVDLPSEFRRRSVKDLRYPCFQSQSTSIHGVSIIAPTHEWSLTHFRHLVREVIEKQSPSLTLLVGGTGLYHDFAFWEAPDFEVKPNPVVRQKAAQMSVSELQDWLKSVNEAQFNSLNHSDQHNPRRLIRKIELQLAKLPTTTSPSTKHASQLVQLQVGVTDSIENITARIQQRVEDRLQQGMIEEVQKLMADYTDQDWKLPAFSATGYKEVRAYLEGNLEKEQMIELWTRHEVQYAKRQLTWWKKQKEIQWFDVSQPRWQDPALALISKWLENEVY